ncbi:DMT family transporter [Ensifer sp. LBL]|uniref:DMT family transporter n=1 Tax=Ensifer sp. LBL TaxID=2991056 RepID=UPI003D231761
MNAALSLFRFSLLVGPCRPLGPRARAAAFAIGAVLFWATWPTLAMLAHPAPPFLVFGLAASVGFAMSLSLALMRGRAASFLATPPRTILLVSVALLTNNVLYLFAMRRIGPAEANVIAYLWPVLLVLILARWQHERLGPLRLSGIALGFVGAGLAIGPTFALGFDPYGVILAFLSGLTFAIYAAIRSRGREPGDVIGPSMGLLAVLAIGLHFVFEVRTSLSLSQLSAIAVIGVVPLTLSNVLWDRASRMGHTVLISSIAYATPLAALALLAIFGVVAVSFAAVAGALLVVIGALAASGLGGRRP